VPNTFEQQARERLGRSLAFIAKAQSLLHDDLLYRSALADSVSAIKNMLQGYLLLRIAATPPSGVTQAWQEIANSNRMPELIAACAEAGLDLRGLAPEIKRLNAERNYRTHEDPARLVDVSEADHALKVAHDVQKRIRDAVQGRAIARGAAVTRAVEGARAVSGQLRLGARTEAVTLRTPSPDEVFGDTAAFASRAEPLPAQETRAASPTEESSATATASDTREDADDAVDSGELAVLAPPRRHRGFARGLLRVAAAVLLVVIGLVGGLLIGAPIAAGHAPGWLNFAAGAGAQATYTATAGVTATATPIPAAAVPVTGPATLGALTIAAPTCSGSQAALTVTNTGTAPLAYSIAGSATGITLAATVTGPTQAAIFGTLKGGASQTLYVSDGATRSVLIITTPDGTLQVFVPAC
jgi:hypothetical protein